MFTGDTMLSEQIFRGKECLRGGLGEVVCLNWDDQSLLREILRLCFARETIGVLGPLKGKSDILRNEVWVAGITQSYFEP